MVELTLISGKLGVLRSHGTAVEGDGAVVLVEHRAEAAARRVTVDDEAPGEVRKLQGRP